MKRFFLIIKKPEVISFFFYIALGFPIFAYAQWYSIDPPLSSTTFWNFINRLILPMQAFGVAIAVIMIIYGGFLYITSFGDEAKIHSAHKTITWAIVGLTVLLLAKGIINSVCDYITPGSICVP